MNASFAPDGNQVELATTVRALLAKHSDAGGVRRAMASSQGYDAAVWTLLCEQVGVASLAIPEEYGGAGFTLAESHVVLEELGAALTPTPFLGSAIVAAQAILLGADEESRAQLLPGIAEGTSIAALAWAEESGWSTRSVPVTATGSADGWSLTGVASYVLDGAQADVLLVLASTPTGIGLFQVEVESPDVQVLASPTMDQTLRLATVELVNAPGRLLSGEAERWLPRLRDVALTAVSALQVGAAERCLRMTVDYSKQRVQFGRPIGSFQALKHRMADMFVDVESSRSISWAAVQELEAGGAASDLAATAKAWCSDALNRVASETVQLHGGIAITWEHDAQLYFKRAHALSQLFGQPREHRARLAQPLAAGSLLDG